MFLSSYVDELYFGSEHEEIKCVYVKMCVCARVCVCVCVCTCMLVQGPAGTYKHRLAVMCLLLLGSGKVEGNSHSSTLLLEILVNAWQDEESGKQVRV